MLPPALPFRRCRSAARRYRYCRALRTARATPHYRPLTSPPHHQLSCGSNIPRVTARACRAFLQRVRLRTGVKRLFARLPPLHAGLYRACCCRIFALPFCAAVPLSLLAHAMPRSSPAFRQPRAALLATHASPCRAATFATYLPHRPTTTPPDPTHLPHYCLFVPPSPTAAPPATTTGVPTLLLTYRPMGRYVQYHHYYPLCAHLLTGPILHTTIVATWPHLDLCLTACVILPF